MMTFDSAVFIAGGGPVGMTLALELAHHGVRSILVERNPTTTRHPKMDLTNGRSMELYRRLGIADMLRSVGVPASEPLDVVWVTSATGHVLHRFAYPAPEDARVRVREMNDGSGTIEPPMRVSQIILEPVLKRLVDAEPLVDVRFGWAYEGHAQDDEGVTVDIRNDGSGETGQVRVGFLAGCDGGGSRVRRHAGIEMEGQHAIGQAYMIHFRSDDREALAKFGVSYHLQNEIGTIISQNGRDVWTFQGMLPPDCDPDAVLQQFVGRDFEREILVSNPWTPHMVVANQYRSGRVFLAGDAAHQVIPTGGYGMNTGVGDAVDLGWKLAAVTNGWGGPQLLESYEAERRPIALQNRAAALRHVGVRFAIIEMILAARAQGDLDAPDAVDRRAALGREIATVGNAENESWGIEHGYRYEESPVVVTEDTPSAPFDPLRCVATTRPGARLPHLYLPDGTALFDLLGPEMSLIVADEVDFGDIEHVAKRDGIPLTIVHVLPSTVDVLERPLVLVRPDHHVAWRGSAAPRRWENILAIAAGRKINEEQFA